MRRIILCLITLSLVAISTAQEFRDNGNRVALNNRMQFNPEDLAIWQTNQMHEHLQLDSIQYQAIFLMNYADAVTMLDSVTARHERAERMRAEGEHPNRPTEEQIKARKEIQKERKQIRDEQMKLILTPEQYDKYLKYDEEHRQRRPRTPGYRHSHDKHSEKRQF